LVEGIGVDIIELARIARAIRSARFRDRVFTPAEQEYCQDCTGPERYAGRFAAKEAVAKALGTSLSWQDVEILRGERGAPVARLHGRAAAVLGDRRLLISISHCREYAVAQALVESR
jgi:holo-[acyl-carrier protein] synthase